jgi:hypothetical protein
LLALKAPLQHLPFVPQGVVAKVSDTTMVHRDLELVTKTDFKEIVLN